MSTALGNGYPTLDPEHSWIHEAAERAAIFAKGVRTGEELAAARYDRLDARDLEIALAVSERIYNRILEELGIECVRVMVRAYGGGAGIFDAIFFVSLEDRVSEDFRRSYRIASEEKQKASLQEVDYRFSFMTVRGEINYDALFVDGYGYRSKFGKG